MTAWLLLATLAHADDAARLLGPEPTPTQAAAANFSGTSLAGLLPLILAGAVAAGIWAWQRRNRTDGGLETATVETVGRHSLGGMHTLHLLDVEDRNGRLRRLVVATGNQGVTLLADLGNEVDRNRDDSPTRATEPRENQVRFDDRRETWNRREDRREDRREPRAREAQDDPRDAPPLRNDDPRRVTNHDRRAQALSLIDEVVGNNTNHGNNDARRGRNSVRA